MSNIETVTQNRRWLRRGSAHAVVKIDTQRRSLYHFWKLMVSNQSATNSGLPSRAGHVLAAAARQKRNKFPIPRPIPKPIPFIIIVYLRSNAQARPLIRQAPAACLALSVTRAPVGGINVQKPDLSIALAIVRIGGGSAEDVVDLSGQVVFLDQLVPSLIARRSRSVVNLATTHPCSSRRDSRWVGRQGALIGGEGGGSEQRRSLRLGRQSRGEGVGHCVVVTGSTVSIGILQSLFRDAYMVVAG
jgi:hypothetical protein